MSEISLKAYEEEIDQLIDASRYLEALAHLRYILSQYPRYVEAYYRLGKMLLETDLPDFAADMFRRVLTVDPEHLEARIGLGLVHHQKNNLDAAIWNLERALELAPDSIEIIDELQQFYEQRDGVTHDRLFRTRAGLARLYLRAQLYGRAIRELRALLAEDPARPDLMTMLAEAYWRDGQSVQAADLCQEILDKMPYHCKANLILGSLWVNSGQDEGWEYLRKAEEVDPENRRALALLGEADVVEPRAITLERLEYDPDAIDVDHGSEWFKKLASLSIEVGVSEVPPEMTGEEMRLADITASLEAQIELPDWLRDLGLGEGEEIVGVEAAGPTEAAEESFDEEGSLSGEGSGEAAEAWLEGLTAEVLAEEEPETGESPDWLLELVEDTGGDEQSLSEDEEAPSPEAGESGWLEALQTMVSGELESEEAAEAEQESWEDWEIGPQTEAEGSAVPQEEGFPGWLEALGPVAESVEETTQPEPEEELPDWLAELELEEEGEAGATPPSSPESAPDWLSELQAPPDGEVAALLEGAEDQEIADLVGEILGEEETPDWLTELETGPDLGAESETMVEEVFPADEVGERGQETVVSEVMPGETEAQEGAVLPGAEEAPMPEETVARAAELESEVMAEEGAEPVSPEEGEPAVEAPSATDLGGELLSGDEALAWLESLTAGHEEELRAQVEAESAERVAELLGREKPGAEVTEAETPPEAVDQEVKAEAEAAVAGETEEAEEAEGELLSGDEALAWLESLTAGHEEELRAQVEAESEARVAELLGRRKPEEEAPGEPGPDTTVSPPETVVEAPEAEVSMEAEIGAAAGEVVPPAMPEQRAEEEAESSEEALAWLESLAAGGEGEIEGQETQAEEVVVPSVETEAAAELTTEGELLSGDEALAWLESLAAGHEEELRAQVETESAARVAELLGRRERRDQEETSPVVADEEAPTLEMPEEVEAEAVPPVEEEKAVPTAEAVSEESEVGLLEVDQGGGPVLETEPPTVEEGVVPLEPVGEEVEPEAVWPVAEQEVASLAEVEPEAATGETVEEVETEQGPPVVEQEEARSAEAEALMGEPEVTEAEAEGEQVSDEVGPAEEEPESGLEEAVSQEPEEVAEAGEAVPEQGLEDTVGTAFMGWTSFGDEVVEIAPSEPSATLTDVVETGVEETAPTEDALAWLGGLPPEKEAALQAEIAAPAESEASAAPTDVDVMEPAMEKGQEAPSVPEEIVPPVADEEEVAVETEAEVPTVRVTMAELEELRAVVKRKRSDHDARLTLARALWTLGEIEESMSHYGRLIKSGARSEEVQQDLERYAQMRPNDANVLKTLGDMYMKSGDLERALAVYNRAMDLL